MDNTRAGLNLTIANKLLVFVSIFIFMFVAASVISAIILNLNIGERNGLLISSCVQNILMFILSSYIIAKIENRRALDTMGICSPISTVNIICILALMILATPMLNQIIYWNQQFSFPESLNRLETTLREWETRNGEITETLLSGRGLVDLLCVWVVVGLLTPIGEEVFFRGGLQRLLQTSMSRHYAIWISAIIFSAMHFQFFGFVPRLLLGAFFGYLYVWTKSLWAPILAHAFNNSTVVILSYLSANGYININVDELGVTPSGIPWLPIGSFILVVLFFKFLRKGFFNGAKDV